MIVQVKIHFLQEFCLKELIYDNRIIPATPCLFQSCRRKVDPPKWRTQLYPLSRVIYLNTPRYKVLSCHPLSRFPLNLASRKCLCKTPSKIDTVPTTSPHFSFCRCPSFQDAATRTTIWCKLCRKFCLKLHSIISILSDWYGNLKKNRYYI